MADILNSWKSRAFCDRLAEAPAGRSHLGSRSRDRLRLTAVATLRRRFRCPRGSAHYDEPAILLSLGVCATLEVARRPSKVARSRSSETRGAGATPTPARGLTCSAPAPSGRGGLRLNRGFGSAWGRRLGRLR